MSLRSFLGKQFIDVIQWNEDEDGVLAYRYPMQDMEIQTGGQLTVRESQMAAFVNEGRIADVLAGAGYHVDTADSGASGWKALQTNHYDVLITDNTMPGVTGLDLIKKLRSADMTLAVILASGTVPAEELNRCP